MQCYKNKNILELLSNMQNQSKGKLNAVQCLPGTAQNEGIQFPKIYSITE